MRLASGTNPIPTHDELVCAIISHPNAMDRWRTLGRDDLTFTEWAEHKARSWLNGGAPVRNASEDAFEQAVITEWLDQTFPASAT